MVVGSWRRRGPTLLGSPSLAPTLLLHKPGARILVLGSLCLAGGWAGQWAAAGSPHSPHLQLIACGQPGVCLCVSALPPRSRSLQLNPFQTRGALSRHHDEAESEADWARRWPFSLSHTPNPATLTLTHTQPLQPPHKQPEFDSGGRVWGCVDRALLVTKG